MDLETVYTIYQSMLNQVHLLIAGSTGSGKSVVINGIMATALHDSPDDVRFCLIDPKRVELVEYKNLPHVDIYASEPLDMVYALRRALSVTETRYKAMAQSHMKKYDGADYYVIIDELADLMTTNRKQVEPVLQRLCQIGRAARVHVIAATQCTLASVVLPTQIKINFDSKVGLRTRSAQDSRNIIGFAGCESLPRCGKGYYMTPDDLDGNDPITIPMYPDDYISGIVQYWVDQMEAA